MNGQEQGEGNRDEVMSRLVRVEQRLVTMQEGLVALTVTNQRLVEEVTALRQGQTLQSAVVSKLEREMRRLRWLRWIGAAVRLLIILALIGAGFYLYNQFANEWPSWLQLFV